MSARELPIIMKTRSVRDIRAGRKTQTRRLKTRAQIGDLLWVREAHEVLEEGRCYFKADFLDDDPDHPPHDWTSPLFLRKKDARLWLRVTSVRQERLHELTDEDARAEGYADRKDYLAAWSAMHGRAEDELVWVIGFVVTERVVFLDLDGVLNRGHGPLVPELVDRLNRITDDTDARIVVHSSWRYRDSLEELRRVLEKENVCGEVIDVAPMPEVQRRDWGGCWVTEEAWSAFRGDLATNDERAIAIQRWLDAHPEVDRFIILDDSDALGHFVGRPEFIRTGTHSGLTDEDVIRAVAWLSR